LRLFIFPTHNHYKLAEYFKTDIQSSLVIGER
jgi:hypothetical protein